MTNNAASLTIEQANPFGDIVNITNNLNDIKSLCTTVEFQSENGIIVALPNGETSLVSNLIPDEVLKLDLNRKIEIYYDNNGNAYRDNGKYGLYRDLLSKAKAGTVFQALVNDITEKGLLVTVNGLQAFLPNAQIGMVTNDLHSLIGEIIEVKIISVKLTEKMGNRFLPIASHKIITDEKLFIKAQEKLRELNIGDIIQGTVKSIVNYGVFVTIFPTIDGLIPIKELSWERVLDPSKVVSLGQKIRVVVLGIKQSSDRTNRITLGLKQLDKTPWDMFDKNSKIGDVVSGTICSVLDYGIFIKLPSGVKGLVHKTELSWDPAESTINFQIGQPISAKILNIDWENQKLLLSLKQMMKDPWIDIDDNYNVGDIVNVIIYNVIKIGVFVKMDTSGIEGFIHVSELSWTEKIKKPTDYYQKGAQVKAIILSIDKEKRQIGLSLKRTQPNPWVKYTKNQHVKAIVIDNNDSHGIIAKLEDDAISAFIPHDNIKNRTSIGLYSILDCTIQEIDENNKRIILAIV
jgi:small subunit ribosomal protein S1